MLVKYLERADKNCRYIIPEQHACTVPSGSLPAKAARSGIAGTEFSPSPGGSSHV